MSRGRREFLRAATMAAVGWPLCLSALTFDDDSELAALRAAAQRPAQAIGKLASRFQWPRVAHPLPFARAAVPGFSEATHRVHFDNHYLEYLWRWMHYEELVLRGAEARNVNPGHHEMMRASANLVILHEVYWRDFSTELREADAAEPRAPAADCAFTLAMKDQGALALPAEPTAVPFGVVPLGAVDWQSHAWRLDFATAEDYARGLSRVAKEPMRGPLSIHDCAPAYDWEFRWMGANVSLAEAHGTEPVSFAAELARVPAAVGLDHERVTVGLRAAAGRKGHALIVEDEVTAIRGVALIARGQPAGMWRHRIVAAITGTGPV